jgi:uncharacterized protein with ParB-like and HNH nuclease domain
MKATETPFVKFLQGTRQFIIPIYQRTYSWTEKQCEQLWNDIIQVAKNDQIPAHFIGSIVYIEKGLYQVSDVPQLLVIDGQQRLTTLSLLLAAFAKAIEEKGDTGEITSKKINNYFLFNNEESGEKHYKLILTQSDKDTFLNLIEGTPLPEKFSKNIVNNFQYFQKQITKSKIDLDLLYQGICKLIIVDISLDSNHDKPQLIFESLNSTGLELSQADLIRNYVLMGLEREKQEEIYKKFWYPIEESFGHSEGTEYFDRFMKDYLTIKTGQIPIIKEVYSTFKDYFSSSNKPVDELISDIHYFSKFSTKLIFEKEEDPKLNQIIHDINALKVDVAYPFLLEIYADYDKGKISKDEVLEIFSMVESYVFRRAICDIPTNSLNKTFANLASEVEKERYLESVKAAFSLKDSYRRFPTDKEFTAQFIVKNVYNTSRIRKHLLDKLENYGRKERVNVEDYTLEHIMPQNKNLSTEWKKDLGEKWMETHEKYLHTVGNLTLTGYNPELSDKPFLDKRDMEGGFADSPIRLNSELAKLDHWNEDEIVKRGTSLAEKAIDIWKYPQLPETILAKYTEVEDEDDEDFDEEEALTPKWDSRLERASNEVKQNVNSLISMIDKKFECVVEPHSKWMSFSVKQPTERKNMFALIGCGKTTANVMFRINPDSFKDNEEVRKVAGWFFPRGTERRITLNEETIPQIMHFLEHAYSTTQTLVKKRHDAAVKAWDTRSSE